MEPLSESLTGLSPQLLVALITAIITASVTLLSVFLSHLGQSYREKSQHERSHKKQKEELKRSKLEELYSVFSRWEADALSTYTLFIPVLSGTMSEKDALDISGKNRLSNSGDFQKIKMLTNLYFPETSKGLDAVLMTRDEVSKFIGKNRSQHSSVSEFIESQEKFERSCNEFKNKLASLTYEL